MAKGNSRVLRPTLWRTCRTLSNRPRLKLFRYVLLNPGLSVAGIASALKMNQPLASKYLRELNARGLLSVTRFAANVFYRVDADQSVPQARALVHALTSVFNNEQTPDNMIFRKTTAFTHPRRVAIAVLLLQGPARFSELRHQLGISATALQRHLHKLASRGFLQPNTGRGVYAVIKSGSTLEMTLLSLAQQS